MVGCSILQLICSNVSEECRNRVLGYIFEIFNVSASEFFVKNNRFVFRMFDGVVFYQYTFVLENGNNIRYIDKRVQRHVIYLGNNMNKKRHDKMIFKLIQCQNEFEVYNLISRFL